MNINEITIQVSPEVANAYRLASEDDRRKMGAFASVQIGKYLRSNESLQEAMAAMSEEAIRNGMTPEILESILNG